MRKITLRNQLLKWIQAHPGWHRKVDLCVIAEDMGYSAESGIRRLRELSEDGLIKKDFYDGKFAKGLVKYTADDIAPETKPLFTTVEKDGQWVAVPNI